MLGINQSGRTIILYQLKEGKLLDCHAQPTTGLNVETVKCENNHYQICEIGGGNKIRPLWPHYLQGSEGLIWVVDSSRREHIDEVKYELDLLLNNEKLEDIPVLIYANKQDLPDVMSASELVDKLGLRAHEKHRWHVQHSSGILGEGLWAGFKWLHNEITKKKQQTLIFSAMEFSLLYQAHFYLFVRLIKAVKW